MGVRRNVLSLSITEVRRLTGLPFENRTNAGQLVRALIDAELGQELFIPS